MSWKAKAAEKERNDLAKMQQALKDGIDIEAVQQNLEKQWNQIQINKALIAHDEEILITMTKDAHDLYGIYPRTHYAVVKHSVDSAKAKTLLEARNIPKAEYESRYTRFNGKKAMKLLKDVPESEYMKETAFLMKAKEGAE